MSIRIIYTLFVLLFVSFVWTGCDCIKGSGNIIEGTRSFSGIHSLSLNGDFEVHIRQDTLPSVLHIEAEDNLMPLIISEQGADSILRIWWDEDKCLRKHEAIRLTINLPYLKKIENWGSGSITAETDLAGSEFVSFHNDGSANIKLKKVTATLADIELEGSGGLIIDELNVASVDSKLTGSGNIELKNGACQAHDITLTGSGNLFSFYFETNNTDVVTSGSGNCEVYVTDELNVLLSGTGSVFYRGNPTVLDMTITGTGVVEAD